MPLRVANWNVYHGTITATGSTPQGRMSAFATYCAGLNVDIIGFQEVPAALMSAAAMNAIVGISGYTWMTYNSEYPPRPPNPAPASSTSDGYAVFYRAARATPVGGALLGMIDPANFRPGTAQCRPPVGCLFQNAAGTQTCQFSTWHNEAGSLAPLTMVGLHNTFINAAGQQIVTGDFNVPAQIALKNPFFPGWNAVTDNLDAILSKSSVQDVALAAPAPFKSDVHFAMVADVGVTW